MLEILKSEIEHINRIFFLGGAENTQDRIPEIHIREKRTSVIVTSFKKLL